MYCWASVQRHGWEWLRYRRVSWLWVGRLGSVAACTEHNSTKQNQLRAKPAPALQITMHPCSATSLAPAQCAKSGLRHGLASSTWPCMQHVASHGTAHPLRDSRLQLFIMAKRGPKLLHTGKVPPIFIEKTQCFHTCDFSSCKTSFHRAKQATNNLSSGQQLRSHIDSHAPTWPFGAQFDALRRVMQ